MANSDAFTVQKRPNRMVLQKLNLQCARNILSNTGTSPLQADLEAFEAQADSSGAAALEMCRVIGWRQRLMAPLASPRLYTKLASGESIMAGPNLNIQFIAVIKEGP